MRRSNDVVGVMQVKYSNECSFLAALGDTRFPLAVASHCKGYTVALERLIK